MEYGKSVIDVSQLERCLKELNEGRPFPKSIKQFAHELRDVLSASRISSFSAAEELQDMITERTRRFITMWTESEERWDHIEYLVTGQTKTDFVEAIATTIEALLECENCQRRLLILARALGTLYTFVITADLATAPLDWKLRCFNRMLACCRTLVDNISRSPVELQWTKEYVTMLVSVLKVYNQAVVNTPEDIMKNHTDLVDIVHVTVIDILQQNHPYIELKWTSLSLLTNNGVYVEPESFVNTFSEYRDIFANLSCNQTKDWYDFGNVAEIKLAVLSDIMKLLSESGIFKNEDFLKQVLLTGSNCDHIPAKNNALYGMGQMFRYGVNIKKQIRDEFLDRIWNLVQGEDCVQNELLENTCVGAISRILTPKIDVEDRKAQGAFHMICNRLPLVRDPEENVSVLLLFLAAFRDRKFNVKPVLAEILQGCYKISTCRQLQSNKSIQQALLLVGGAARIMFPDEMVKYSRNKSTVQRTTKVGGEQAR